MNNKIIFVTVAYEAEFELKEIATVLHTVSGITFMIGSTNYTQEIICLETSFNEYAIFNDIIYKTKDDFEKLKSLIEYYKTIEAIDNL